jgi:hypothetical protein
VDNNGDGLIDCADPTCTTVECVPAVVTGNEIGVFVAGACPMDYGPAETWHQTLVIPDCTGCGCVPAVTCTATGYASTSDAACGAMSSWGPLTVVQELGRPGGGSGVQGTPCTGVTTPVTVQSFYWGPTSKSAATTGAPAGSATAAAAYWDPASSMSFCPARTSLSTAACPSNQVCVRTPSTPVCARVPTTPTTCPGGYGTGISDTWYSGINDNHSCGSCGSCTVQSTGDCDGRVQFSWLSANACVSNPTDLEIGDIVKSPNSGMPASAPICESVFTNRPNRSVYNSEGLGAENASCTCSAPLNNPATRTGGSTICCR